MTTAEMIEEVKRLLEEEMSVIADNDLVASYKARNIASYSQALKSLTDVKRLEDAHGKDTYSGKTDNSEWTGRNKNHSGCIQGACRNL